MKKLPKDMEKLYVDFNMYMKNKIAIFKKENALENGTMLEEYRFSDLIHHAFTAGYIQGFSDLSKLNHDKQQHHENSTNTK